MDGRAFRTANGGARPLSSSARSTVESPDRGKAAIESLVNRGLPGFWYPVVPSWALGGEPIGITRLCRNIVLWRDSEGAVRALDDRCPHRGARLSLGRNLGDRLSCWYHGVEVNDHGDVVAVPAVDDSAMRSECKVKAYTVEERHDAIFVYFDRAGETAPPLTLPEELSSEACSHMLCTATWRCNYQYAVDNVMDPMHGAYLHAQSHSMAEGAKVSHMQTRRTETGFIFEKTDQSGLNFDWTEWGETNCLWLRLSIPYQRKFGPGGPFFIIGFATPLDEDNTMVFFWRVRRVQGWQRNVWRFLYRNRLEGLHWHVLEQDRVMLENLAPGAREHEYLYQHDIGLSRVRRRMREIAAEMLSTENAASRSE